MISIESTGKTVKQAIEDGLKKIDRSLDEVEVKIITQPGIFKKAKVLITVEGTEGMKIEPPKNDKSNNVQHKTSNPSHSVKAPNPPPPKKDEFSKKIHEDKRQPKEAVSNKHEKLLSTLDQDSLQHNKGQGQGIAHTKMQDIRTVEHPKKEYKEKEYQKITDEAAKTAIEFCEKLLKSIDPDCSIVSKIDNGGLFITVNSGGGAIIGYKGETLDAIEYLTLLSISRGEKVYKVIVDCNEYRTKRHQMLVSKARTLADKAVKTGRKIALESMSSQSRKIIHAALADNDRVFTKSEGNDPHRHIIIVPKRKR